MPRRPKGAATPLLQPYPDRPRRDRLHGPRRTAVRLHPAPGRWPAHETDDRLALALGLVALAVHELPGALAGLPHRRSWSLATGIAAADGALAGRPGVARRPRRGGRPGGRPLGGAGARAGRGRPPQDARGLVPRLADHPDESGPFREVAALALLVALAAERRPRPPAPRARRRGRPRLVPRVRPARRPRNALAFALNHVDVRLTARRAAAPPGVLSESSRHRNLRRRRPRYRDLAVHREIMETHGRPQAHRAHRARQPQARPARLGPLQPRHPEEHELYATGTTGGLVEDALGLPGPAASSADRWAATSRWAPASPRGAWTSSSSSGTRSSRSRTTWT